MPTPEQKIVKALVKPEEGLAKGLQKIDALLAAIDKAEKSPITLTADKLKSELRTDIEHIIEFVQYHIISFAAGDAGFRSDPTGLLTGRSNYSTPLMLKKYKCAHLVDEYAKEIVAEKLKKQESPDCYVSATAVAQTLSDESNIVDIQLTDGSHIQLNKEESTVGVVNQETGKISWYKSKYDLAKNWSVSILSWFYDLGVMIKEWLVTRYQRTVEFWTGDEDTQTS